ncbi:hypothetical protein [Leptospira kmetyi]|uniref:Uncharacterized protein n=1 Tax=Leptospira kmetyi TaxID=408139 RepID=A0ABX4N6W1_9LEPT|nr:hypothetical protein [Leptospira kmetyi]PJZ29119.1 hypothetical protein CH378_14640 [Leptospira kmetyi]PJZ39714.1 hypothetical protein CH370_19875 [Leptospira kmetyi]
MTEIDKDLEDRIRKAYAGYTKAFNEFFGRDYLWPTQADDVIKTDDRVFAQKVAEYWEKEFQDIKTEK